MRLDHLLSKECRRPVFGSATTEVEHWLLGVQVIRRRWRTASHPRQGDGRSPRGARLLGARPSSDRGDRGCRVSLFRFEGTTLGSPLATPPRFVLGGRSPRTRPSPRGCQLRWDARRVPARPLRIPERARASLFSKLERANGGCLGACSRRRTWATAICHGELSTELRSVDFRMGQPGTRNGVSHRPERIGPGEGTGGIETSEYPEERKATATP